MYIVAIPEITRQRLASSVVGTPGVDTSGQKIGESVAASLGQVAAVIGDYTITQRNNMDIAEANDLQLKRKEYLSNTFEQMKETYAAEPEKMGPAFNQALLDSQGHMAQTATNPRVGLMVGRGDPYFDGHMVMGSQAWMFTQKLQNDKGAVTDGANRAVEDAGKLVIQDGQTYDGLKRDMLPIFSRIGNLTAGAFALAHPASAQKFQDETTKAAYLNIVGKMIDHNPMWAQAFLQEPETKKLLAGEPMYERMQKAALEQVKNFQQNQEFNDAISLMAKNPDLMQRVNSGRNPDGSPFGWSDLVKMDPGHTNPMVSLMEQHLLNNSPSAREEQQSKQLDILERARQLGLGKGVDGKALSPTDRVNQLVDFHKQLLEAQPFMTKTDFDRVNSQVSAPLTAAVIAAHSPNLWESVRNTPGSLWSSISGDPRTKTDTWAGGYDTINDYFKSKGMTKDTPGYVEQKLALLSAYTDQTHKVGNPEFLDVNGRKYTPETLAQSVIHQDFKVGGMWPTPLGMRQITGFKSPGNPTFNFTDEDITRYNLMKKKAQ